MLPTSENGPSGAEDHLHGGSSSSIEALHWQLLRPVRRRETGQPKKKKSRGFRVDGTAPKMSFRWVFIKKKETPFCGHLKDILGAVPSTLKPV